MATGIDGKLTRRTVAKAAAWSVPVVATAAAAPAAVASPTTSSVEISASCGAGGASPSFTITAVGAEVGAGSIFTTHGSYTYAMNYDLPSGWTWGLGHSGYDITSTTPIPADGSVTISLTPTNVTFTREDFTLESTTIAGPNQNAAPDQAALVLTVATNGGPSAPRIVAGCRVG